MKRGDVAMKSNKFAFHPQGRAREGTKPCLRVKRGDVAEWLKAPVSKTGIGETRS